MWSAATALFFLLRAADVIRSVPLCFFLSAVAAALAYSIEQLWAVGPAHPLLRLRQTALVLVIAAVPSLFDPDTLEVFNLPRLVLLLVAATVILVDWGVDAVWGGWRPRRLVNGFQWVLLAIVVWFGVTTLTSVEPRQSLLGRYGSYEGLLLIAALAVLASALSESFDASALPALFRVVVASLVPLLVYGVIQLYGFVLNKHSTLDFVHWHTELHNVFATMGNANHLAGYLVTFLPIGVITASVLPRRRWARVATWSSVALVILLVLQTGARGAWLGGLAGGAVLVVALFGKVRTRARTVIVAATAALVVAVALIASNGHFLGTKATSLFRFGSGSSVSQRYGYWSSALRLAVHHPLTGTGPDTYAVMYARYQDATLARELGTIVVNGAHNIFLSWLANEGFPGLVLIVALLATGLVWATRTYRSRPITANALDGTDTQVPRYLVAGLAAAMVAYFVQASFDVEQVATLFALFVVVGLLGTTNRAAWREADLLGIPIGRSAPLRPAEPTAEHDAEYPLRRAGEDGRPAWGNRRPTGRTVGTFIAAALGNKAARRASWGDQRGAGRLVGTLVATVLGLTAVGLVSWRADALWRADNQAHAGNMVRASELNPWEPSYLEYAGQGALAAYRSNPNPSLISNLEVGVGYFRQAVALDSYSVNAEIQYGTALQTLATAEGNDKAIARNALAAFERARQDDPFDTQLPGLINATQKLIRG